MFGVGKLLRTLDCSQGAVKLASDFSADLVSERSDAAVTSWAIGARANSWDAWTPAQFDQYIRDLVVFGANSIENIPFEDSDRSVLMPIPRDEMNLRMAEICVRYDVDHWLWVPVEFKLPDTAKQAAFLKQQEAFYRECPCAD